MFILQIPYVTTFVYSSFIKSYTFNISKKHFDSNTVVAYNPCFNGLMPQTTIKQNLSKVLQFSGRWILFWCLLFVWVFFPEKIVLKLVQLLNSFILERIFMVVLNYKIIYLIHVTFLYSLTTLAYIYEISIIYSSCKVSK